MSLQIKQGSIKYGAGKIFDNPYQPGQTQQNIVCTMDDGSEEKLYFQTGRQPHAQLRPGDRIQIVYETGQDGKRKRRLVAEVNSNSNHFVPAAGDIPVRPVHNYQQPAPAKPKEPAYDFIDKKINIMVKVMARVRENINEQLTEESIRSIATSIIIEGSRKGIDFEQLLITQEQIVPTVSTEVVSNYSEDPILF